LTRTHKPYLHLSLFKQCGEKVPVELLKQLIYLDPHVMSLLWITGPTGAGKSTVAAHLRDQHQWAFYEGDCYLYGLDPFSGPLKKLPELSAVGKERMKAWASAYLPLIKGEGEGDIKVWDEFYSQLCQDIKEKREQNIGKNFVVSQAVYTRRARDLIRNILGNDVTFAILQIDNELQVERMCQRAVEQGREVNEEMKGRLSRASKGFEEKQEDEEQSFEVIVNPDQEPSAIADSILQLLRK